MPATCRTCNRMVHFVRIGGELTAVENALISAVPAIVTVDSAGTHVRMTSEIAQVRQLHATLCPQYVEADRKKKIADEKREYERLQARSERKNFGL